MAFDNLWGDPRRLKTAARFLLRSLTLRRASFLMALLALSVAATLTASLLGLKADLHRKMTQDLRGFGPNLLLTPSPGSEGAILDEVTLRKSGAILAGAGIRLGAEPALMLLASGAARLKGPADSDWRSVTISGSEFTAISSLNPGWKIQGRWPKPSDLECVLGSALAERMGAAAGDVLEMRTGGAGFSCPVRGILATGESEEEQVLAPLSLLQGRLGIAGRVSLAALSVGGGAPEVTRAARHLERSMPGVQARVLWQVAHGQGALLAKLDRLSLTLSAAVFLLCSLCVMTTLLSSVLEREPEIGLMRSLGAGDGEILGMFLGEVTLLGVLGAAIGAIVGAGAARILGERLFGAHVVPRLEIFPVVLAVSLALGWISVLPPLRRALSVRPAEALRGE